LAALQHTPAPQVVDPEQRTVQVLAVQLTAFAHELGPLQVMAPVPVLTSIFPPHDMPAGQSIWHESPRQITLPRQAEAPPHVT
jgi:hypothetical protein